MVSFTRLFFDHKDKTCKVFTQETLYWAHKWPGSFRILESRRSWVLQGSGSYSIVCSLQSWVHQGPRSFRFLILWGSWVLESSASLKAWVLKHPLESWVLALWDADVNLEHIFPLFYRFSHPTTMFSLSVGNHRARKQYKFYTFTTELDYNGYLLVCFRDFATTLWITKVSQIISSNF